MHTIIDRHGLDPAQLVKYIHNREMLVQFIFDRVTARLKPGMVIITND